MNKQEQGSNAPQVQSHGMSVDASKVWRQPMSWIKSGDFTVRGEHGIGMQLF